ncbi:MAG: hypothetical protein Q9228_003958 [Teloschistes exilis]
MRKLKLGVRDPGDQRNDVNLPYRFISDDAVCVIEIGPPVGGSYDIVTSLELARAAFSIVEGCVSNVELGRVGGEVRGLATNGCMLVVRADVYTPRPDKATWYDIWAAAVAVRQVCVLKGQAGQAMQLGTSFSNSDF